MSDTVRILVADDHPLFREGAVNTLTGETDFEVVAEASTGEAAVTLAVELVPDIAILDLTMPGDGGIVATRRIAAQTSTTAILVLTVSEDTDDLLQALKAGARGYVVKGVSGDGLIHAVRSVIAGEVYVSPALASGILGEMIRNDTTDPFEELTPREREVLELVADGQGSHDQRAPKAPCPQPCGGCPARPTPRVGRALTIGLQAVSERGRHAFQHLASACRVIM